MADINFSANLDTSGFTAGIKNMQTTAKNASSSIKITPVMDMGGLISGTAKMVKETREAEKAFATAYKAKETFLTSRSPSAAGMASMAKVPNMGDLLATMGKSSGAMVDFSTKAGAAMKQSFIGPLTEADSLGKKVKEVKEKLFKLDTESLPKLRYALYDVAGATKKITDGLVVAGGALVKASMDFESAFTNIERTSLANERRLELLNLQFRELATSIPLAFSEITTIGALGAQLGLADSELSGFSKTVAQFSATTNVSTESAAQSFGALAQLLGGSAKDFDALGSSIAYVGINSVATETEILSVATAIGGVAAQAGISAEYVVGLSGAMASLRIPAEQSRGALTRVFQEVNRSAASGVEGMQGFANIMGISAQQATDLAGADMEGFFTQFVNGLSGMDAQQLTTTLDSLNLADIRVTNVLARLAENNDVLAKSLADSGFGFENSSILSVLYGNRVEDLAAKVTILQNSFQDFLSEAGDSFSPVLGPMIDMVTDALNNLSDALSTDAGKSFASFAMWAGIIVTSISALSTGFMLMAGTMLAFRTILLTLNPAFATATTGAVGLIGSLLGVNKAALVAGGGMTAASRLAVGLKFALAGIAGVAIIAGIVMLVQALDSAAQNVDIAFKNMVSDTSGLAAALKADATAYQAAMDSGNAAAADGFTKVDLAAEDAKNSNEGFTSGIKNMYDALDEVIPQIEGIGKAFEDNTRIVGDATRKWITSTLLASENFQKLFESTDFTSFVTGITDAKNAAGEGFSINTLIDMQAAGKTKQDMLLYMYELQQIAIANNPEVVPTIRLDNVTGAAELITNTYGMFYQGAGEVNQLVNSVMGLNGAYYLAGTATEDLTGVTGDAEEQYKGLNDTLGTTAEKIRTVEDYANDLSSVWSRAFDIRFRGQDTLDAINSAFSSIAKSTADAREEITGLNVDIGSLTADRALQEYFLSVAEAYGDSLAAGTIRAKIAKIDADLAAKNKSLAAAQVKTSKTLVGSTDAAIDNRAEITGLVGDYQDHIKALAASGMSQADLRAKSVQLKAEFMAQATQLGYNTDELGMYAAGFDDVTTAIDNVPRDITVGLEINGLDAGLAAVNEFIAKARAAASGGITTKVALDTSAADAREAARQQLLKDIYVTQARMNGQSLLGIPIMAFQENNLNWLTNKLATGQYSSGGYTGAGGMYDVAGIVHKGEYVVPKSQVNQGTQKPYFMEQTPQYFTGGYVGGNTGSSVVSLSPEDRALLRNVGGSGEIILYANNEAIARSTNAGNKQIVASGGRP